MPWSLSLRRCRPQPRWRKLRPSLKSHQPNRSRSSQLHRQQLRRPPHRRMKPNHPRQPVRPRPHRQLGEKTSPVETAPAPRPATADKPPAPSSVAPVASPAPTSRPRKGPPAGRRETPRAATTLTIVNGRAVPATSVAVLVGAKAVTASGATCAERKGHLERCPELEEPAGFRWWRASPGGTRP